VVRMCAYAPQCAENRPFIVIDYKREKNNTPDLDQGCCHPHETIFSPRQVWAPNYFVVGMVAVLLTDTGTIR
jgi:hypothetical protein